MSDKGENMSKIKAEAAILRFMFSSTALLCAADVARLHVAVAVLAYDVVSSVACARSHRTGVKGLHAPSPGVRLLPLDRIRRDLPEAVSVFAGVVRCPPSVRVPTRSGAGRWAG